MVTLGVIQAMQGFMEKGIKVAFMPYSSCPKGALEIARETADYNKAPFTVCCVRAHCI